jgi:hypothetical protein
MFPCDNILYSELGMMNLISTDSAVHPLNTSSDHVNMNLGIIIKGGGVGRGLKCLPFVPYQYPKPTKS